MIVLVIILVRISFTEESQGIINYLSMLNISNNTENKIQIFWEQTKSILGISSYGILET